MWRHSLHVSGFFLCPAEASGRQGRGVSHTPPHTPRYMERMRVPRAQTPFKRHSNSVLRAVGEGHQGCLPSWPGTSKARTKQTSPASVDAPRARKASKHAAERFRDLGKRQNTPLNVSEASEGSKYAAEGFRGVGRDASQAGRVHQTRTRIDSPASGLYRGRKAGRVPQKPVPSKLRRRPQMPRGGSQKLELAPPPPLEPPPHDPPLSLSPSLLPPK